MLGSSDMALRVVPDGLVIILDEYASTASAAYLIANVISDFDGYDASASHIGAAAQDPDGGLEFSDPTDGSEPFLYTDDGTANGKPLAVRLDPVNAAKYFAVEIAKFDGTEHGALSETVVFDYESGEVSSSPDAAVQITLCIRISYGYASADGTGSRSCLRTTRLERALSNLPLRRVPKRCKSRYVSAIICPKGQGERWIGAEEQPSLSPRR